MTEFLVIVLAIVVAQFISIAVMFAVLTNEKFLKLYAKKTFEMGKVISKEMEDMFEEEEL